MSLLKNNALIKEAFLDAENQLLHQYCSEVTGLEWVPSFRFESKMQKLIQVQKRPYWKYINSAAKRAAVILLAVLITSASAMSVKAIREPIINTIIEIYEKFTKMIFSTDNDNKESLRIETSYSLSRLPETFSEKESLVFEKMRVVSWENDLGERIQIQQSILTGGEYKLDTEENALTEIAIGTVKGHSYISKGYENWIWHNETYAFNLSFPQKYHSFFVDMSENEELVKIIE